MKILLTLSAALTAFALLAACATDHGFPVPFAEGDVTRSNLSIPPGRTFVLGGDQPGSFIVQARNAGDASVVVTSDDGEVSDRTIHPRSAREAIFAAGQTALIRNTSDKHPAQLKVTITSPTEQPLGMRYVMN